MKKNVLTIGKTFLILLLFGGLVASCSSDDGNSSSQTDAANFSKEYFTIQGSQFINEALPDSNSDALQIIGISGNSTVLAGGSNLIHITASDGATEVIAGIKGKSGYYVIPMHESANSQGRSGTVSQSVMLSMLLGQALNEDITLAFAVSDGNGNYSGYEYLTVTYMQAGTGNLHISLSWDQPNDVDLHIIEPNGEEIYYGHMQSANGGYLDVDSNPACNLDYINNENIFYQDTTSVTVEPGEYQVLVDLWDDCDVANNTNYTVVAHYMGQMITPTQGVNPLNGYLTPADESHNTDPQLVMTFDIPAGANGRPASAANLSETPSLYRFHFDKTNKVFKNYNVKK